MTDDWLEKKLNEMKLMTSRFKEQEKSDQSFLSSIPSRAECEAFINGRGLIKKSIGEYDDGD